VRAIVDEHSVSFEEYIALVKLHEEVRWRAESSAAPVVQLEVSFSPGGPDSVRRQTAPTIPAVDTERDPRAATTLPCNSNRAA
jgi:hypothetical protein